MDEEVIFYTEIADEFTMRKVKYKYPPKLPFELFNILKQYKVFHVETLYQTDWGHELAFQIASKVIEQMIVDYTEEDLR